VDDVICRCNRRNVHVRLNLALCGTVQQTASGDSGNSVETGAR